ncbi:MAG: CD225/dispanin family protein [Weeksellaceae bacterium]|jgi:hypothetical protein|nr:CD225/dispanin family protein [Weeksellaceae bacterium]MDX9705332.1 CD225/dispanin family protein [Weeksellaceae bacterium]
METNDNIQMKEVSSPPDNYLAWAIISTILCCWPIGIFAIIKSTKVNSLWQQGEYAAAQKASEDAKKFSIYAAASGFIFVILYLILVFVLGIGGSLLNEF